MGGRAPRPRARAAAWVAALAIVLAAGPHGAEARHPEWLALDPPLVVSAEGFRGVPWCTVLRDVPWAWDEAADYPTARKVRRDEDLTVFGERAEAITYTFRNTAFYGVRIDLEGAQRVRRAAAACARTYPPADGAGPGGSERHWATPATSVWVTLPEGEDSPGQIYLWGRDRAFAEDARAPVFVMGPPALDRGPERYRPRHVVYRASAPIRIDGRLDEKAWQDAAWTEAFEDHQAPYAPPPWKTTRAKMLYDDEGLYVAARLQEENVWGAIARRDSIVYYENDIEVFLDPTAGAVDYFEFELNPLNTMFDMFHLNDNNRGALADRRYDAPGARHAVSVQGTLNQHHDTDDGWTMELMIPLADLASWNPRMSLPVRRGDLWRVNFSRVQYLHVYHQPFPYLLPDRCEDWVWNTVHSGSLHVPEMWGKVLFSDRPAGAGRDEALEAGFPFRLAPDPPAPPDTGRVHFAACRLVLGPDPTDPIHSPAHEVEVPEFWMDRCEVTVAKYAAFLNEGGRDALYDGRMAYPELCGLVHEGPGALPRRARAGAPPDRVHQTAVGPGLCREPRPDPAVRGDVGARRRRPRGASLPLGRGPPRPGAGQLRLPLRRHPAGGQPARRGDPGGSAHMAGNAREWTTTKLHPYPGGAEYEYYIAP